MLNNSTPGQITGPQWSKNQPERYRAMQTATTDSQSQTKPEQKPEPQYFCLDLQTSRIDQAAATIAEIERDITRRVEMARAEGYHDEQYGSYVILDRAELAGLKWYHETYTPPTNAQYEAAKGTGIMPRGTSKNHYWKPEQVVKFASGPATDHRSHAPRVENFPMKENPKYKYGARVPAVGKTPRPNWTTELEAEYADATAAHWKYLTESPGALAAEIMSTDLDPLELLPF